MKMPLWVQRNPEKYLKRLHTENEMLQKYFPSFKLMQENDGTLFAEGQLLTLSNNLYKLRIYYPDTYPYNPPIPIVMDNDVKRFCMNGGQHTLHNYGEERGGLYICVIKPDDVEGTGWTPDFTVIFIICLAAAWLHAYEVKRANINAPWILPEA